MENCWLSSQDDQAMEPKRTPKQSSRSKFERIERINESQDDEERFSVALGQKFQRFSSLDSNSMTPWKQLIRSLPVWPKVSAPDAPENPLVRQLECYEALSKIFQVQSVAFVLEEMLFMLFFYVLRFQ